MNAIPNIIVQLIHIEGPLKGEIQELSDPEIIIGRHPDCQVQYPKDVVTLSRKHARIVREGNRFKLIDQSTNGTFVNGQQTPEAYLKDGDVITFSEGGPKLSFLTQVSDQPAAPVQPAQAPPQAVPATPQPIPAAPQPIPATPQAPQAAPMVPPMPRQPAAPAQPSPPPVQPTPAPVQPPPAAPQPMPQAAAPQPAAAAPPIQSVKVPFAIQYGPALKSFQNLPITLGKNPGCDFVIDHPAMSDQQVRIFYAENQYWIKDMTGTNSVTINGLPIGEQAPLQAESQVALSPQGPKFRFLAGGRMAEIEEPAAAEPPSSQQAEALADDPSGTANAKEQKSGGLFKKFFSS